MWWRYNEHPPRALKLGSCIWKEVLSIDGSHPDQFESIRKRLVTAPSTFRREGRFVDISCTLHQGPQWAGSVGASQKDQSTFFVQSIGSRHRRQFQTIALVQRGHGSCQSPKSRRAGTFRCLRLTAS